MIGIFDSGIGGLTVFKAVAELNLGYRLLYLGDTARLPYGNRSQELVYKFTQQAVEYLFNQGCELVILACNTASSEALRKLQQEWLPEYYPDRRILGVIKPVVEEAISDKTRRIGIVGTTGTIKSKTYEKELNKINLEVKIFQQACPLLVPLVEEGWQAKAETKKIIRKYLRPLKQQKIDTLILGCTHYPILFDQFAQVMGKNVKVLDSPSIVASKLKDYLSRHPEIESKLEQGNNHKFLVTDVTDRFAENAQRILGYRVELEKINIE